MLTSLRLQNLGVIVEAALELEPGLTALTGETGAGKTMVLTSLRLVQGNRADPGMIRLEAQKAHVDAVFEVDPEQNQVLADLEVDTEEGELFVARTIAAQGRSRALVNGRPVPARILTQVTEPLIVIHGQTDQLKLRDANSARELLDEYAGQKNPRHLELLADYRQAWQKAVSIKRLLDEVEEDFEQKNAKIKYLSEVVAAIDELALEVGEEETLESRIEALANVDELKTSVCLAEILLSGDGQQRQGVPGVLEQIGQVVGELQKTSRLSTTVIPLVRLAEAIETQIQDLQAELKNFLDDLFADPDELERLSERKAKLFDLMRGRATTVKELLEWSAQAKAELAKLRAIQNPQMVREELDEAQKLVVAAGGKLRSSRQTAARELSAAVTAELKHLSMGSAKFQVQLEHTKPTARGMEKIELGLQPHPSAPLRKLGEGASGGELSRVMLALEVILGAGRTPKTYVFDEVDAGIGGAVAVEVANRLKKLAETQQVLVVTHLPQVAAAAKSQYVVTKDEGQATVRKVTGAERVDEIARMLAGDTSSAARRHASQLLEQTS